MQEAVDRNPLLSAWFFKERMKKFFDLVVTKVLKIEDWFNKLEWQDRGTGDLHGVAWSSDMDDLMDAIINDNEDTIGEIVGRFNEVISECNPVEDPKNTN